MDIYLASNNEHKARELECLFPGLRFRLPKEAGLDFDPEEDGPDYLSNALIKARALHALVGAPVLADDSGLAVDALGGEPGIRSARYGQRPGEAPLGAEERNAFLLARMAGVVERSCRFVCCLVLILEGERVFTAQETCEGVLLEAPRGLGGFGYDPVVWLPELGRSVAELSEAEKGRVSHRGRAARRLAAILSDLQAAP